MKSLETLIRTAVKSVLAYTDLSNYKINKIAKAEVESPRSWGIPGEVEITENSIRRYYENIHSSNVFQNFVDHLLNAYSISYYNHIA